MAMADTSLEARLNQIDVFAVMSGNDKMMLAVEMAEQSKSIAIDGIRSRNPHFTDADLANAWLELLYGSHFEAREASGAP